MADYNVKGKMTLDTGSFISSANAASNSLNGLNTSVGKTSAGMKYLKRSALAAGVALGGLAMAGVKAASDYQQSMIAFTKMMGSAEKATQFVKELQDFAAKTPFELPQVQAGAKKLMAFGFEASQVLPMLTAIGDAASGLSLGSEGIDRLTLAIGQMQAKGKVSGGELRQLAEAGIPALQYLADAYGKTTAEILKMSEEGAIPASAGVGILIKGMEEGSKNAMGFKGMMEAQSKTMAGLMSTLKDTVRNAFVNGFNKYVPAISGTFETMLTKVGPMVESFIEFMGYLVSQIGRVLGGIATVLKPIFENFLIPAFKIAGGAVLGLLAVFAKLGDFMKKHAGVVEFLVNVIGVAALSYAAFRVQTLLLTAATKLHTWWQTASTAATKKLTAAQRLLNLTMAFNPIGLIVAAITALIAGFVLAWNNSEKFRKMMIQVGKAGVMGIGYLIKIVGVLLEGLFKVVTGPLRLLLKGLELLGVDAAGKALKGIEGMTKGIGDFFDKAGNKVQDFADKLDALENKRFKLPSFGPKSKKETGPTGPKISDDEFKFDASSLLDGAGEEGAKTAAKLAELKRELKVVVQDYNDFITNDFAKGFVDGADNARDTIMSGLDNLRKIFDKQKEIFEAAKDTAGMARVEKEWDKINAYVRSRIAEAMAVAKELEEVSDKLDDAYDRLKEAVAARKEGAKAFEDLVRKPFGEPNELSKGLASGEATVDGIIGMYDRMREALEKRFTEIGGSKKNELISYLTDQTAELVKLAKKRDLAATALDEAQKHLEDVLSEQKSFEKSIVSSMKSFGTALADLSKTDSDTTIKVIKTASGLVITQMGQTKSGVDTIVDKLKSSLATIKEFTANIQTLLTRGYNKEYVRQLLEAGPEAAGATAALLAKSGDDTVNTINGLYAEINTASEQFGTKMSETFYGNSVSMAQAMVKGAQSEYGNIMAQMKKIADGIEAAFGPLADVGLNVGNDIIQDMINALEKRKGELIALAQSIAAQIAAAMAAAAAAIGVGGVTSSISGVTGSTTTEVTPEPDTTDKTDTTPKTDTTKKPDEWGKATTTAVNAAKKVIVKSGDTLSAIAKANDTTVKKILAANPKFTEDPKYKNGNMIWAGTTVKIPTVAVAGAPLPSGFVSDSQNAARLAAQNTTVEKGAVTVNLTSNIPASDVEGVMTRSFLAALSAR